VKKEKKKKKKEKEKKKKKVKEDNCDHGLVKMSEKNGSQKRKVFVNVQEGSIWIEIQKGKFLKNERKTANQPLQRGPK
jgi:hypothetical protein